MGYFDHLSLRAVISGPPCEKHLLASDPSCGNSSGIFSFPAKWAVLMRILVSACIVAVGCALQPPHAKALTANELVESCNVVEQSAQSAPGDTVDISPEGLPCWYYMSAVQDMSALVDSKNERLLALCPPAESTTLDFVRAFLRSAERKNETDVNNPAVLVLHALTKAYPCHGPTTDRTRIAKHLGRIRSPEWAWLRHQRLHELPFHRRRTRRESGARSALARTRYLLSDRRPLGWW